MCDPITATIGAAVIGAGASAIQGSKSRKQAQQVQASNERQAQQQAQRAEEQFNRANQKQPGVAAMFDRNRRAAGGGVGSTFLTGIGGVPTGALPLGGGSLLGS